MKFNLFSFWYRPDESSYYGISVCEFEDADKEDELNRALFGYQHFFDEDVNDGRLVIQFDFLWRVFTINF